MRQVAAHLGISRCRIEWPARSRARSKVCARQTKPLVISIAFEGGIEGFLFKGTNGRWRDVLDADDIEAYRRKVAQTLPVDAARWIRAGGRAA